MLMVMDVLKSKDSNIWAITSKETAYRALEIMDDKDIGALLVIDEGQLIGIFSERDYARKVILEGKSSKETTVGELMTSRLFSISPDKSIEECMALMTAARSRHMPVMEAGKLVGVVSLGDLVSVIIAKQKIEIDDLKNYVTGGYSSE
jgi:CBS domain-containing protein